MRFWRVMVIAVVLALALTVVWPIQLVATALGTSPVFLAVYGDSMYPTLKFMDLVVLEKVDIEDVRIGDIVAIDLTYFGLAGLRKILIPRWLYSP